MCASRLSSAMSVHTQPGAGGNARLVVELRVPLRSQGIVSEEFSGLAVDTRGRMYLLDRREKVVRVVDSDGRASRVIGRPGRAFAGLRNPAGIMLDASDRLWVVDPDARSYVVFDTTGALASTYERHAKGFPSQWRGGFGSDGRLYDTDLGGVGGPVEPRPVRCNAKATDCGALAITNEAPAVAFELRDRESLVSAAVPFTGEPVWQFDGEGGVWSGRTDHAVLRHLGPDGRVMNEARLHTARESVTAAERAAGVESLNWFVRQGGWIDTARFGRVRPPIEGIATADRGGVWVRISAPPNAPQTTYERFARDGRYLGRVETDRRLELRPAPVLRRQRLYGLARGPAGQLELVRFREQP
jgi:hypothetical protein